MPTSQPVTISAALAARFSDAPGVDAAVDTHAALAVMAARGSCRQFADAPVPDTWLRMLGAIALASPTKSDLQQRDIIMLHDPARRRQLAELIPEQAWIAKAPMIAVFCGNNRRQRFLHAQHDVPFANDHFDAAFNAIGDAAIALGAFVTAAEALGLGCCPISAVRNAATEVSDMLGLPEHVFPFAGLAFGFPATKAPIAKRLPLSATYHVDRYTEDNLDQTIGIYDADRAAAQPYSNQRLTEQFGHATTYTWSDDKVRQYSQPERADFGMFMRGKGFRFD